jgi:hypothetical protein
MMIFEGEKKVYDLCLKIIKEIKINKKFDAYDEVN